MNDLSNREVAQETGEELTPDRRDALKQCLDEVVALVNARLLDGLTHGVADEAPEPSE